MTINILGIDRVDENNGALHTLTVFAFNISEIDAQNAEVVKFSEDEIWIASTSLYEYITSLC